MPAPMIAPMPRHTSSTGPSDRDRPVSRSASPASSLRPLRFQSRDQGESAIGGDSSLFVTIPALMDSLKRVVALVLLLCAGACGPREKAVKIAVAVPLTGDLGSEGQGLLRAVELAVEQANAAKR